MLEEKKQCHRDYRQAKSDMKELLTARSNVEQLFNATERQAHELEREQEQEHRRRRSRDEPML